MILIIESSEEMIRGKNVVLMVPFLTRGYTSHARIFPTSRRVQPGINRPNANGWKLLHLFLSAASVLKHDAGIMEKNGLAWLIRSLDLDFRLNRRCKRNQRNVLTASVNGSCDPPNINHPQAFREALPKIEKLAAAANPGLADASSVRTLSNAWSTLSSVHALHTRAKEQVIFPELEGFFPGQVG